MILQVSELIYLSDAAKQLKQAEVVVFGNELYGYNNLEVYASRLFLDPNKIQFFNNAVLFNQKALSSFLKTITSESAFNVEFDIAGVAALTSALGDSFYFNADRHVEMMIMNKKANIDSIINSTINLPEYEITNEIASLYSMKKDDGLLKFIFNNKFISLFYGLLPINKNDKVFLKIQDSVDGTVFYSIFRVVKPKYTVVLIVSYLNMPYGYS